MDTTDDYDRRLDAVLEDVRRGCDGAPSMSLGRALEVSDGVARRDAARAATMRKRRGTYPFPIHRQGRREYVLPYDVALALVGPRPKPAQAITTTLPESQKRGPGRPRKIRPAENAAAAGGVT